MRRSNGRRSRQSNSQKPPGAVAPARVGSRGAGGKPVNVAKAVKVAKPARGSAVPKTAIALTVCLRQLEGLLESLSASPLKPLVARHVTVALALAERIVALTESRADAERGAILPSQMAQTAAQIRAVLACAHGTRA
jgi:hypothetical protein